MNDISWNAKRSRRQELKEHVRRFLLLPAFWEDSSKIITNTITWTQVKFDDNNSSDIPNKNGVYCFVVEPPANNLFDTRYLFYIGKASSAKLRARYKNYIDEKNNIAIGDQKPRIKVQEMLNDYLGHIYFYYAILPDKDLIVETEEKLLNTYMPYVNTSIPELKISEEYKHIY